MIGNPEAAALVLGHLGLRMRIILPGHRWQPTPRRYRQLVTELPAQGAVATFNRAGYAPPSTARAITGTLIGQGLAGTGGAIAGAFIGAKSRKPIKASVTITMPSGASTTTAVGEQWEDDARTFTALFNAARRPQ